MASLSPEREGGREDVAVKIEWPFPTVLRMVWWHDRPWGEGRQRKTASKLANTSAKWGGEVNRRIPHRTFKLYVQPIMKPSERSRPAYRMRRVRTTRPAAFVVRFFAAAMEGRIRRE